MQMKKKIARIQRWVDRMTAACDGQKWDSALMEADCLSAEVRETREKLLSIAESDFIPQRPKQTLSSLSMLVKSAGIALLIVCCSTIPSAVEADRPWIASAPKPAAEVRVERENLRWITPEEEALLKMIRADMDRLEPIHQASVPHVPAQAKQPSPRIVIRPNTQVTTADNSAVRTKKEISDEELMALIQIGSKALRTGSPAVRVIN